MLLILLMKRIYFACLNEYHAIQHLFAKKTHIILQFFLIIY